MKKLFLGLLFTCLSLFAADGQSLSAKCVACHGVSFEKSALGKSAIVYGQSAIDIYGKLLAYKGGTRSENGMGALMKGQVASMSEKDLWSVAYYISTLSAPAAEAAQENDWAYACSEDDLSWVEGGRYFKGSASSDYPLIAVDTKTIQIDRKNKTIKVWTAWFASNDRKQSSISDYGYKFNDYGYDKGLDVIDYKNLKYKTMQLTSYSCTGNVIVTSEGKKKWTDITPDSVMEGLIDSLIKKYNLK